MADCSLAVVACPGVDGAEDPGLHLAIVAARAGDKDAARRWLHAVLDTSPGNSRAWHWLSTILDSPIDAADCLRHVVALDPTNRTARGDLERLEAELAFEKKLCPLCGHCGERPHEDCAECGARLTMDEPRSFFLVGRVHLAQMEAAVTHYRALLTAAPDFATQYALGLAYLNLRRWKEGLAAMQAAAALRPYSPGFAEKVEKLRVTLEEGERPGRPLEQRQLPCVLVVDDSPTVRMLVRVTLEREGYQVIVAKDGFEAVHWLNQVIPDLVLLDVVMPGIDGYSLCKVIRGRPETSHTAIVMLSAKEGFFDRIRSQAAGADGYLLKPIAAAQLLAEIRSFLPIKESSTPNSPPIVPRRLA